MIIGIVIALAVLAGFAGGSFSLKIVKEYKRIVVFRLGKVTGIRGPGLVQQRINNNTKIPRKSSE